MEEDGGLRTQRTEPKATVMHPQAVGLTPKQTTCAPAGSQNCYGPMAPIFPCCQLGFLCSSPLPVPLLSLGVRTR